MDGDLGDAVTLAQLAHRPGVKAELILNLLRTEGEQPTLKDLESALADSLYAGYIETQRNAISASIITTDCGPG